MGVGPRGRRDVGMRGRELGGHSGRGRPLGRENNVSIDTETQCGDGGCEVGTVTGPGVRVHWNK